MENLSEELIIEIFKHLSFNDICNLTITCRQFNQIISNSSASLDKFQFILGRRYPDEKIYLGTRKYRKVVIYNIRIQKDVILKFFETNGRYVKEATIYIESYLDRKTLIAILNNSSNLKHLNLRFDRVGEKDDGIDESLPTLKLDSLNITCDTECDEMFTCLLITSVKKFKIEIFRCETMETSVVPKLSQFLKLQKELKHISIITHSGRSIFVDFEPLIDADFKLTTFELKISDPNHINKNNLEKFLINQENLQELRLEAVYCTLSLRNMLNYLRTSRNIKTLCLAFVDLDFQPMPYVEKVTIRDMTNGSSDFCSLFPNAREMSIDILYCFTYTFVKELADIDTGKYTHVKIPMHIKSLMFDDVLFKRRDYPFDSFYKQIDNLKICNCQNINWLIDCLKNGKIQIKSLEIDKTKIKRSHHEYLKSLHKEKIINELKIENPRDYFSESEDECERDEEMDE